MIGEPCQCRLDSSVLIFFGVFILWGFGWETVGDRLKSDVNGVVIASRDVPSTGAPRYATEYTVRNADGKEQVFWAGPTDGSLPRSMPMGTRIRRERWHLDYERDGQQVGFPYVFYGLILAIGLGVFASGIFVWLSPRKVSPPTETHRTLG
jgi:hypothetical protein